MFSSIKKTLLNVTKNVGLLNIEEKNSDPVKQVNLEAGFDVLEYYQKNWEIIHATNEENARKAQEASKNIETIARKIKTDKQNYELIIQLLSSNFKSSVQNCTKQIDKLYETCQQVEKDLVAFEDLLEDIELEQKKQQHLYHLELYKLRKLAQFDKFKVDLEQDYQKAVVLHDLAHKGLLEERQKVFQDAFKSDLEQYKSLGSLPKLDLPKKQSALLEEIQLDLDETELEQFFEDDNLPK